MRNISRLFGVALAAMGLWHVSAADSMESLRRLKENPEGTIQHTITTWTKKFAEQQGNGDKTKSHALGGRWHYTDDETSCPK